MKRVLCVCKWVASGVSAVLTLFRVKSCPGEVKDTTSGPPGFGSGRLTGRLKPLLDGDGLRQDALKIQERHLAKDVAGRGKKVT